MARTTTDDLVVRLGGQQLDASAATALLAVVGRAASGKTTTAMSIARQLLQGGVQVLVLDAVGAWAPAPDRRRLHLPVAGGPHGDGPFDPAGAAAAVAALPELPGAIIDLSLLSRSDRGRAVAALLAALFATHDPARPLHLVIEEVGLLPRSLGELGQLGGPRGIGATLIAQRLQAIATDALSQVSCLLAHRLVAPQDRRALGEWVPDGGGQQRPTLDALAALPLLEPGEALLWRAATPAVLQRLQIRAGTAPQHGAVSGDEAVARWLAACAPAREGSPVRAAAPRRPRPRVTKPAAGGRGHGTGSAAPRNTPHEDALHALDELEREFRDRAGALRRLLSAPDAAPAAQPERAAADAAQPSWPEQPYARDLLRAVVQAPGGSRARIALLAGKNCRSRAFRESVDALRSSGHLRIGRDGGMLRGARAPAANDSPSPDGAALVARWATILGRSKDGGMRRGLLEALHAAHPAALRSDADVLEGLRARDAEEFAQATAALRSLGLAEEDETSGLRLGAACGLEEPQ